MSADYEDLNDISTPSSIWYQKSKLYVLVFVLFMIINSQVFILQVIDKLPNTTDINKLPTNRGVIIQSILFSIAFIIIDILIAQNWL